MYKNTGQDVLCVCMCVLPEVSVLAVHGHTRSIWTGAEGESSGTEGKIVSDRREAYFIGALKTTE